MAYVFASAADIGMSQTTLGQMSVRVARVAGAGDQPDRVGAFDAIRDSLRRLNEYDWEFLAVNGTDIDLVAGQATYDLPTPFRKPMSLRLVSLGGGQTLAYVRQSDLDSTMWSQTGRAVSMYTMWNSAATGKFTLVGTPTLDVTGGLAIKYYRPITDPTNDLDKLDILDFMERYVKLDAQVQVALEQNVNLGVVDRLTRDREDALKGILGVDRDPGVANDQGFISMSAHGGNNFPSDHPYAHLSDEEF